MAIIAATEDVTLMLKVGYIYVIYSSYRILSTYSSVNVCVSKKTTTFLFNAVRHQLNTVIGV